MTSADTDRLALYNRLQEVLGVDPATTLMSHLPPVAAPELLTKAEFGVFQTEMREFKVEMREFKTEMREFRSDTDRRFEEVNKRIDRILLAVVAGQFVLLAAILGTAVL